MKFSGQPATDAGQYRQFRPGTQNSLLIYFAGISLIKLQLYKIAEQICASLRVTIEFLRKKLKFSCQHYVAGKGTANPSVIPIPWIHSPVASELGTASLRQPRHDGEFHLME